MTVRVRMSAQVNGWTSKTLIRTKGICNCDSENNWISKTVVRTKGIEDCDSENEWTSKWMDK